MKILESPRAMQETAEGLRRQGKTIALVPTMGYLHEGHLSLMREGKRRADVLVSSLFVNPTQFGPKEDLASYPRNFERDCRMMGSVGVDILFHPSAENMYSDGFQTYVTVEQVTGALCGVSRPHHFRGVATVVAKLFNIVKPHVALFGEKDFQQVVVIKRMVRDLDFDIEIVGCPIVREADGLAMSSRNSFLNEEERREALFLKHSLDEARSLFRSGARSAEALLGKVQGILSSRPAIRVDYVRLCDAGTLEDIDRIQDRAVLAVAAYVGRTRLIDNFVFPECLEEGTVSQDLRAAS